MFRWTISFRSVVFLYGKFLIINPPYQDETIGENKGFAPPVYHLFLDEAVKCSNVVEMIHPARFLFDAGSTPKAWNKKMLSDTHFKILDYFPISADVFSNTDIKGGVVISCYNSNAEYGAVGIFTKYRELNTIIKKVIKTTDRTVNDISISSYSYHFTEAMHADFPNARSLQSKGHAYDLKSNIFDRLPMIFHDDLPQDNYEYIEIIGRTGNERKRKFIRRDYIKEPLIKSRPSD